MQRRGLEPVSGAIAYSIAGHPMRVYFFERLAIHWPAAMPEPNPQAKKAILAANETSFHVTTEKATAKTRNMIDTTRKAVLDFMRLLLIGLTHAGLILDRIAPGANLFRSG
jgi:hypothetical protein